MYCLRTACACDMSSVQPIAVALLICVATSQVNNVTLQHRTRLIHTEGGGGDGLTERGWYFADGMSFR